MFCLTIVHLYPESMNTYGDNGNVEVLRKRAFWRGIEVNVKFSDVGDIIPEGDIYFWGGGQDISQNVVSSELARKSEFLGGEVERNKVFLLICGGYQLMGEYYITRTGERISGVGVLSMYTVAGDKRMIGNTLIESGMLYPNTIVGFENHSGKTYIKGNPLGIVRRGFGNNGEDGTEGMVFKNVVGCYQHGPLLPKNPHLADWLIGKALSVKYQKDIELPSLNDELEWKAHSFMLKRRG